MSLSETSYDEAAINQMKEKEVQEEQAKLEQQQKTEREKSSWQKRRRFIKGEERKRNHVRQKKPRKSCQKSVPDESIKNNAITVYKGIRV